MRVMHIASGDLWAGAEVQAYNLLSQLRHQCDLKVVLLNEGRLADELRGLSIDVAILDERTLSSWKILQGLRQLMKQFRPDVIHTHRKKENILGSFANLMSTRSACVRTSHGAPEFSRRGMQHLQALINDLTGRHLQQAVIAVSSELGLKLRTAFPVGKIHVIHNGIDVKALRKKAGVAGFRRSMPEHAHVGIVGRLEAVKRVDIFLDMIPVVLARLPAHKICFHVIGDGKLRQRLEQQAEDRALSGSVIFHGHRNDIPDCINSMDAIIMCSDHEGTPMTALEAVALGTPLIGHRTGGLIEVLSDYPQLLVEDHTPRGYAECLVRLLSESERPTITENERYTAERNAERTVDLYQRLLLG